MLHIAYALLMIQGHPLDNRLDFFNVFLVCVCVCLLHMQVHLFVGWKTHQCVQATHTGRIALRKFCASILASETQKMTKLIKFWGQGRLTFQNKVCQC